MFKLALVTGASSGIGTFLSNLLADEGVDLILAGRNEENLNKVANSLRNKVNVTTFLGDLSVPAERKKLVEIIHQKTPDLIINNAGFGLYGEALSYSTDEQMKVLTTNADAVLELTLEGARSLKNHGKKGVIMNIASNAAFYAFPLLAVYAAAKTFVVQVSQALDDELTPHNIRVLVSCPGMVDTPFSKRAGGVVEGKSQALATTPENAAKEILWQIKTQKQCHTFDWKARWLTYMSYLLPKSWLSGILRKMIEERIVK